MRIFRSITILRTQIRLGDGGIQSRKDFQRGFKVPRFPQLILKEGGKNLLQNSHILASSSWCQCTHATWKHWLLKLLMEPETIKLE